MSDDEEVVMSEEESEEEEEESRSAPAPSGPSEAELAMQRRRAATKIDSSALDEEAQELLSENAELRSKMEEEIEELRQRSEQRKKEREEEERQMAVRRQEEEARRKKEEEERNAKKKAEEDAKRQARADKMAEFEKWKDVSKPNFVISKKDTAPGTVAEGDDEDEQTEKKSKEQLEAEKRAILDQRTPKLEISGFDSGKLTDKAKELHNLIMRLESEKYDLERRFKIQQMDMMELAERARSMNKVGRGGLKRIQLNEDEVDKMSERFAGCPSKIVMYSQFERQKDPRGWGQRQTVFTGPHVLYAADKIPATRIVKFNADTGLPEYEDIPGMERPAEEEEEE